MRKRVEDTKTMEKVKKAKKIEQSSIYAKLLNKERKEKVVIVCWE